MVYAWQVNKAIAIHCQCEHWNSCHMLRLDPLHGSCLSVSYCTYHHTWITSNTPQLPIWGSEPLSFRTSTIPRLLLCSAFLKHLRTIATAWTMARGYTAVFDSWWINELNKATKGKSYLGTRKNKSKIHHCSIFFFWKQNDIEALCHMMLFKAFPGRPDSVSLGRNSVFNLSKYV